MFTKLRNRYYLGLMIILLLKGSIVRNQLLREFGPEGELDPALVNQVLETFKTMVGTTFLVREPNLSEQCMSINPIDVPNFIECNDMEKYQASSGWSIFNLFRTIYYS